MRLEILRNMLYKNNRCNEELAKQVENGGGYQFLDCPPILFSPAESILEPDLTANKSHSISPSKKPMRSSLINPSAEIDEEEKD